MIDNIIFVSFEQGGGGHRLARVIASLPGVYWYSNTDNGINPWNITTHNTTITARSVSPAHFDRIVPNGKLPPTWDYVREFFPFPEYYYNVFKTEFARLQPQTERSFVYCTHSTPSELKQWFPACKVINMIHNVDSLVDRYMQTTAKFPGWLRLKGLVHEDNPHLVFLKCMRELKKEFTIEDIWAQRNHGTMFNKAYYDEYRQSVSNTMHYRMEDRKSTNDSNVLNVETKNWKEIKLFLSGRG